MYHKITYNWHTGISAYTGKTTKKPRAIDNYIMEYKNDSVSIIHYDSRFLSEEDAVRILRIETLIKLHSLISSLKNAPINGKDMSYVWKDYEEAYNLIKNSNTKHC